MLRLRQLAFGICNLSETNVRKTSDTTRNTDQAVVAVVVAGARHASRRLRRRVAVRVIGVGDHVHASRRRRHAVQLVHRVVDYTVARDSLY